MLPLKQRKYIKNKLTISLKIKKTLKQLMLKSIIHNKKLQQNVNIIYSIKYLYYSNVKTRKSHVCLYSGKNRNIVKHTNLNRHEFHTLCRSNKINNWSTHSW